MLIFVVVQVNIIIIFWIRCECLCLLLFVESVLCVCVDVWMLILANTFFFWLVHFILFFTYINNNNRILYLTLRVLFPFIVYNMTCVYMLIVSKSHSVGGGVFMSPSSTLNPNRPFSFFGLSIATKKRDEWHKMKFVNHKHTHQTHTHIHFCFLKRIIFRLEYIFHY